MLVLPMTMAPASSNFCSDGAFLVGRACCSAGVPPDVGISVVLMLSLTTIGRPARAPRFSPASTFVAAVSAPSLFRMMNALRSLSCSARSRAACTALVAVIFLSRIAATISAAVGELESAIAKLTYPREGSAAARAARAIDDVRISRREGLAIMGSSRSAVGRCLLLRPLGKHALGLAERAFQRFRRNRPDPRRYADGVLDMGGDPLAMLGQPAAIPALGARFRQHRHLVHSPFARQFDDEMAAAPVGGEQHFLDLGREHVDAAQDDQVIGTPGDFLHPPHAGPRRAR